MTFLEFGFGSDYVYLSLTDTKTDEKIGSAKIGLKKLYEDISFAKMK